MTPKQVADQIGFDVETIRRWRASGKIPGFVNFGTDDRPRWKISQDDLDAFVASRPGSTIPIDRAKSKGSYKPPEGVRLYVSPNPHPACQKPA